MTNPDTLLAIIRAELNRANGGTLAHYVRELDAHLSAGGAPPAAWREGPELDDLPTYKVGESDPTPDDDEPWCEAASPSQKFSCTWPAGHHGQHVAGDGARVCEVWS